MSEPPLISVVIPLYNKGPYIARALNSVLAQTVQDFEIIVVDGRSNDDGPLIVKSSQEKRIILLEQKGWGVSSARNQGIYHSQSDFIAFLDADDEWMNDHLETLLRLRIKYPDAGAYSTAYIIANTRLKMKKPNFKDIPKKPWEGLLSNFFKSAAFSFSPVLTSAVGIPRKILVEFGGFNENYWLGEDIDLWARIALKYPIAFSWGGMVIYHKGAENRACERIEPLEDEIFCINARKALESREVPPEVEGFFKELIAKKQIQTACRNIHAGRPDLAKDVIKNCKTRYFRSEKFFTILWIYLPYPFFKICRAIKIRIKRVLPNDSYILEKIFKLY